MARPASLFLICRQLITLVGIIDPYPHGLWLLGVLERGGPCKWKNQSTCDNPPLDAGDRSGSQKIEGVGGFWGAQKPG